jgi:hypothetical protein
MIVIKSNSAQWHKMLSTIMLSVVMLIVAMLNVMALFSSQLFFSAFKVLCNKTVYGHNSLPW